MQSTGHSGQIDRLCMLLFATYSSATAGHWVSTVKTEHAKYRSWWTNRSSLLAAVWNLFLCNCWALGKSVGGNGVSSGSWIGPTLNFPDSSNPTSIRPARYVLSNRSDAARFTQQPHRHAPHAPPSQPRPRAGRASCAGVERAVGGDGQLRLRL